ncbi:MAG TPA: hypothetical protein VL326_31015, partial [Kofleriaceae bacterium]|nr:hypothetical protein [Kofleriaceae bacterium]
MDGWLIGTGTYAGLAVLTFLPVLRNVIRGVRLHSGGASFDDAKHFSADAKQRLKQHYSRMQGTLGFWKKHAETYRYLHYYSLCWAIPSSLAIPILTQSLSATDVWSKILLTVISTHSALVLTFHRALKVDANYKAFRQGESE